MLFAVRLEYQNIESGGSRHYHARYLVNASGPDDAARKGREKLGCNLDGRLFSIKVVLVEN